MLTRLGDFGPGRTPSMKGGPQREQEDLPMSKGKQPFPCFYSIFRDVSGMTEADSSTAGHGHCC